MSDFLFLTLVGTLVVVGYVINRIGQNEEIQRDIDRRLGIRG